LVSFNNSKSKICPDSVVNIEITKEKERFKKMTIEEKAEYDKK